MVRTNEDTIKRLKKVIKFVLFNIFMSELVKYFKLHKYLIINFLAK